MVSFQGMGRAALGAVPALGELTDRRLAGLRPQDLTVIVQATGMEDRSFAGGIPATEAIGGATP